VVDLKKECVWLKEVNSQSLQVALLNLDADIQSFSNVLVSQNSRRDKWPVILYSAKCISRWYEAAHEKRESVSTINAKTVKHLKSDN
jgi:hypothetical protein